MRGMIRYISRHHVALLALFVALGGTSAAATNALLPKNSVGTAQLKNGAVTKKKINRKAIAALRGNRGLQGPRGEPGPQGAPATKLWGVFDGGGGLFRGSGVTSSARLANGRYEVVFNTDVSRCSYQAMVGLGAAVPNNNIVNLGVATAQPAFENPNAIIVATGNPGGSLIDKSYYVAVFC